MPADFSAFLPSHATGSATFAVHNPANGAVVAHVADQDVDAARRAIDAAHAALPAWSGRTAKERAQILRRWFDLMMANAEALAALLTAEQGKPLAEAMGEVAYGAAFVEWFAEEGKRAYGRTIPTTMKGKRYITIQQPVGVAAAITPWNFPIAMITRKVGPALAAGCTVVVKPSEETPLSALAIAKLAYEAGVPADALRIVTSLNAPAIGTLFCEDPRIAKLSFTGSTAIGKKLYAQCADTVKKLSLELGGNAPLLIFDDADLEQAVAGALAAKFRNAGQTCVCANRLYVQDGIHDRFVAAFAEAVGKLKIGAGDVPDVQIGPLINQAAKAKVRSLVDDAVGKGAAIAVGADTSDASTLFYAPTILTGVTGDMDIAGAEIFGPVAPVTRFVDEAEGIALANNSRSGLAAYIYSRDIGRAWRVAERIEAGMVGVNEGLFSSEVAPFGGVKESGLGREGATEGLAEYLETKYICLGGIDA